MKLVERGYEDAVDADRTRDTVRVDIGNRDPRMANISSDAGPEEYPDADLDGPAGGGRGRLSDYKLASMKMTYEPVAGIGRR